jgi:hypothetical protein
LIQAVGPGVPGIPRASRFGRGATAPAAPSLGASSARGRPDLDHRSHVADASARLLVEEGKYVQLLG